VQGFDLFSIPNHFGSSTSWQDIRSEERKKIIEVMTYVKNNLDWIANIPKVKGYESGPVEKAVDITVARKFKKRGMNWHKRGANPFSN